MTLILTLIYFTHGISEPVKPTLKMTFPGSQISHGALMHLELNCLANSFRLSIAAFII